MARPDGEKIRERRRRKGLSVRVLAARAGIAEKTLRQLERNRVETPHPETIRAVAGALCIEPEALFSDGEAGALAIEAPRPLPARERAPARGVPGFSGRPPVAVMRFENLSGDPDQQYFADGLVEDLIARLSAWRVLPVVARSSSIGAAVDALPHRAAAEILGARYLVRGSVRRAEQRVRVSVQLIDAETEHPIWAESFDRETSDVLLMQDEISVEVVARLGGELSSFEEQRAIELGDSELEAWDLCMRGWWHIRKLTLDDAWKAASCFEAAVDLDPALAMAWMGRAQALIDQRRFLGDPLPHLKRAREWAERAVQSDPKLASAYALLSSICLALGDLEGARDAMDTAIRLDPSSSTACLGLAAQRAAQGRTEDAVEYLVRAIRLDALSPQLPDYLRYLAAAYMLLDRFKDAATCLRRAIHQKPDLAIAYCDLAAAYGLAGQTGAARELRDHLRAAVPNWSPERQRAWIRETGFWPRGLRERYIQGLQKAGWTELLE